MKIQTKPMLIVPLAALLALTLTACSDSDDGNAEQMGRKIDNATEQMGQEMDSAGNKAEAKLEDARDAMSGAMERAGDKVEEMGDEIESKTD